MFTELEQQAGARMGRGLGQLLLWPRVHRVQLFTGFKARHDRGRRRLDHEPRRDAGPPRARGLAADRASARGTARRRAHSPEEAVERWSRAGSQGGASLLGNDRPVAPAAAVIDDGLDADRRSGARARSSGRCCPNSRRSTARTTRPSSRGPRSAAAGTATSTRTCARCSAQTCSSPTAAATAATAAWARAAPRCGRRSKRASKQLAAEQGPNPALWRAPNVRITFPPGLLPYTMRWTNRSTFQQVIEFTGSSEH